jgi:hypothetical protein
MSDLRSRTSRDWSRRCPFGQSVRRIPIRSGLLWLLLPLALRGCFRYEACAFMKMELLVGDEREAISVRWPAP